MEIMPFRGKMTGKSHTDNKMVPNAFRTLAYIILWRRRCV